MPSQDRRDRSGAVKGLKSDARCVTIGKGERISRRSRHRSRAGRPLSSLNKTANRNGLIRLGKRHVLLGLIAQTEALQERRRLGVLHRLTLCSGVVFGRDLYSCILLPPDLFSGILHRPDLCSRILHVTDLSVHWHGPDLSSGILHNLWCGILSRLHGSDLCPLILLCCPRLVLLEQVIG